MKPIKLTLRAFGPYKNEEIIDFTELQNNRLFVISGTTGAGKTTIFDGISFALYGIGSGQDRKDTKMLRSDFADDSVHTAVELIFTMHDRTYRILRQLPHVKEGRKTATGDKIELFEIENGEEKAIVERQTIKEVNPKIEEIIGLSYDQFSQIVMLPQGEFRKLLTSSSDNKEEILRKIFKTNRFGEMNQKLEEKKKLAEQELERARNLKSNYIVQIAGTLPKRESLLFEVLEQHSNIYQIQEALDQEILYYKQMIQEHQQQYEEAIKKYNEKFELYSADKALNERIVKFEEKKIKLNQLEQQRGPYEDIQQQYEAAIQAGKILPLNELCLSLSKDKSAQQATLATSIAQLENAEKKLVEAQKLYEEELLKQAERDEVTQQVHDLQKLVPLYKQIEEQKRQVNLLKINVEQNKAILLETENKLKLEKEQITQLTLKIEQLEEKTSKLNQLLEKQLLLRKVIQTFENYHVLKNKEHEMKQQFTKCLEEYTVAKQKYENEESKWLNNQAARLAATLVKGAPCPVCGSTDHQEVQLNHGEMVDEQSLKVLKESLERMEKSKNRAEVDVNTIISQINFCEEELTKLQASIDQESEFIQQFNKTNQAVQLLKFEMEQLSQDKAKLKQLYVHHEQSQQQFKQKELSYQQLNEKYLKESTVLVEQQRSIPSDLQLFSELQVAIQQAEEKKRFLFTSWENIQKYRQETEKQVTVLTEVVKQTSGNVARLEEKLTEAKNQFKSAMAEGGFENYKHFESSIKSDAEIKQLQHRFMEFTKELHSLEKQVSEESVALEGKQKVDLVEVEQQLQLLKANYEHALQTYNGSKTFEQQAIDFSEKLDHVADKIFQLEEISNQVVHLYNLLRGQNSKKISFERYVQMGYLEQITEAANLRLRNLSNGQYYLQCSDRQESHGRQSGLSLDVFDTYTGQSRDVKSLSGGEKFNASLCLALGMADVIQSFQGNVKIDTMFIDEGFGSLDEESLMKAIDALIDLQKTGRMIGVISHVAELKAAIPAILQVEKLKEGYSKTSIVLK